MTLSRPLRTSAPATMAAVSAVTATPSHELCQFHVRHRQLFGERHPHHDAVLACAPPPVAGLDNHSRGRAFPPHVVHHRSRLGCAKICHNVMACASAITAATDASTTTSWACKASSSSDKAITSWVCCPCREREWERRTTPAERSERSEGRET